MAILKRAKCDDPIEIGDAASSLADKYEEKLRADFDAELRWVERFGPKTVFILRGKKKVWDKLSKGDPDDAEDWRRRNHDIILRLKRIGRQLEKGGHDIELISKDVGYVHAEVFAIDETLKLNGGSGSQPAPN